MSEPVKPCPWCQREPHVSDCGMPENKDDLYAWCLTDGCANQQKVYKLTAWNRRSAPEPARSDRERAEAWIDDLGGLTIGDITNDEVGKLAAEFAAVRREATEIAARRADALEAHYRGKIDDTMTGQAKHRITCIADGIHEAATAIRKGE